MVHEVMQMQMEIGVNETVNSAKIYGLWFGKLSVTNEDFSLSK